MKNKLIIILLTALSITACVSIPKETVTLSQTLGKDLVILHNTHRNMVRIYYGEIKKDINLFIDEQYAPFIIHFVLKLELASFKNGEESLYGDILAAGESGGKKATEKAVQMMLEFQTEANHQINKKRKELLDPILAQEATILTQINQSYDNAIYANSTITGYLKSVQKVKEAQKEALTIIGLGGIDTTITEGLLKVSSQVKQAIVMGKDIDIQSDEAYEEFEKIMNQIKSITNKK